MYAYYIMGVETKEEKGEKEGKKSGSTVYSSRPIIIKKSIVI